MHEMFSEISTKIIRSNRKTLAIELKQGEMIVRAPYDIDEKVIEQFLQKKKSWIEKHWLLIQQQQKKIEQLSPYTAEEMKELVEKGKEVIPQKVDDYAKIVGVDYGKITIRCQRTRWGSCSNKGNLNFNCLLLLLPDEMMDYVIVHELCHRKEMNHSAQFYGEIEKVLPNYRECQKWLKEKGSVYLRRIAKKNAEAKSIL